MDHAKILGIRHVKKLKKKRVKKNKKSGQEKSLDVGHTCRTGSGRCALGLGPMGCGIEARY
jgi:hypothetical protein